MSQADNPHTTIVTKAAAAAAVSTLTRRNAQQPAPPKFFDPATITTRFYGHILVGDCLHPNLKDGDKVLFDREAPLENGCFACFYYRPELVRPGHLSVALKKLTPPFFVKFPHKDHPDSDVVPVIIVEQFNPHQRWSVRCSDLLAVHRCLGRADDPEVKRILEAEGWRI